MFSRVLWFGGRLPLGRAELLADPLQLRLVPLVEPDVLVRDARRHLVELAVLLLDQRRGHSRLEHRHHERRELQSRHARAGDGPL